MSEAEITPDQSRELKDRLTSKRNELIGLVKTLSEATGTRHDFEILDVGDSASLHEVRVRAAALMKQHDEILSEIDAALKWMKERRYGVSEVTGEPISFERLLVIPWTRTGPND